MKTNYYFSKIRLCAFALLLLCVYSCSDDDRKRKVVCWGDSLTAPHYDTRIKGTIKKRIKWDRAYPERLQGLLGDKYEIVNCGVGGENTLTIAARQGSIPMFLKHDIILFPDTEEKTIGTESIPCFLSVWDSTKVTPLLQNGWDKASPAHVNPCTIQGLRMIVKTNDGQHHWLEKDGYHVRYDYLIRRADEGTAYDTLKAGAVVSTEASRNLRAPYANIFFIGQNGGFKDVADLIAQYKTMIEYGKTDKYIVIGFHKPNSPIPTIKRMKEMEDSLSTVFGKHYINLRSYLVSRGLADARLEATAVDRDSIRHGQVPPQLLTDGCHFTRAGYELIARLVKQKFDELGY